MGFEPNYIVIDGQTFSKVKLALDNHVYKNCQIDDCDLYYSGGQYELLDTHVTNSRLVLNHPLHIRLRERVDPDDLRDMADDPVDRLRQIEH